MQISKIRGYSYGEESLWSGGQSEWGKGWIVELFCFAILTSFKSQAFTNTAKLANQLDMLFLRYVRQEDNFPIHICVVHFCVNEVYSLPLKPETSRFGYKVSISMYA